MITRGGRALDGGAIDEGYVLCITVGILDTSRDTPRHKGQAGGGRNSGG